MPFVVSNFFEPALRARRGRLNYSKRAFIPQPHYGAVVQASNSRSMGVPRSSFLLLACIIVFNRTDFEFLRTVFCNFSIL
jgi:hypothetical protein